MGTRMPNHRIVGPGHGRLKEFPAFMRNPKNAVDTGNVAKGLVGYLFEGLDGEQMVLWQCTAGGTCAMHAHDYDEYAVVLQGTFTGTIGGKKVVLKAGDECLIPAGVAHGGEYSADYRAIDAFGGRRVKRVKPGATSKSQRRSS